jgi:hypothetical protein
VVGDWCWRPAHAVRSVRDKRPGHGGRRRRLLFSGATSRATASQKDGDGRTAGVDTSERTDTWQAPSGHRLPLPVGALYESVVLTCDSRTVESPGATVAVPSTAGAVDILLRVNAGGILSVGDFRFNDPTEHPPSWNLRGMFVVWAGGTTGSVKPPVLLSSATFDPRGCLCPMRAE